ncbi:carbon starvation protein A [bacterium]|nr:carbon starvation protein A [bacterium]
MSVWMLLGIVMSGYWLAYHTVGRYLAQKIFKLDANNPVPSRTHADGCDYVASEKPVMFGHHFTSIAGTGPIVGPAIGVIWGWLPAVLWVFFGAVFMGAVHDFASLVISVRHHGRSVSWLIGQYVGPRVRHVFFILVFLALLIVIAIFGMIIALIFAQFPQSVLPVWFEIPIAIGLGYCTMKFRFKLGVMTAIAVGIMYATVVLGAYIPIRLPDLSWMPATGSWTLILLVYAYVASTLPVQTLMQPRDFMNAWQLYIALGLIVLGIIAAGPGVSMTAPAVQLAPTGAPSLWPFLCITIACGAISGFHCLVCSGTSSKQLAAETDAKLVGYGSMLVESALAVIVIVAVTAGLSLAYTHNGSVLTGLNAWSVHYGSWAASAGLASKLSAVVVGCANFLAYLGISQPIAYAIIGVFIASFAGTTLDTATRIQRYILSEWGAGIPALQNRWISTAVVIGSAAVVAFSSGVNGTGALALWPLFGAVNQVLAGLALLVATLYLRKKTRIAWLVTGIPCLAMMGIALWALILNQAQFMQSFNILLSGLNGVILILVLIIGVELVGVFLQRKRGIINSVQ